MNKLHEALREIVDSHRDIYEFSPEGRAYLKTLDAVLAETSQPVAELRVDTKGGCYVHWLSAEVFEHGTKLYAGSKS